MMVGWVAIIYLLYKSNDFIEMAKNYVSENIAIYVIPLGFVLINNISSLLCQIFTACEKWEFKQSKHASKMSKIFVSNLIGSLFYVGIHLEFVMQKEWFTTSGIMQKNQYFNCKIDQAGINIVASCVFEAFLAILGTEFINWFRCIFGLAKPRFKFEYRCIRLIILNSLFVFSYIWYPAMIIIAPVLIYLLFYYYYYVLSFHSATYKTSSHENVFFQTSKIKEKLGCIKLVYNSFFDFRSWILWTFY